MNQPIKIIQARLPGFPELMQVKVNQEGLIESCQTFAKQEIDNNSHYKVIDLEGDWLSLGGIDLQINGALGIAFTDLEQPEQLISICQFLESQGIDGFLPTLVTTSRDKIRRSLQVIATYLQQPLQQGASILGVHLEGPFLHPEKQGAHPEEYLLPLTRENVDAIIGGYENIIKIITLAPELDTEGTIIPYLTSLGIIVSLGHSLATATQARQAFAQGATMVTHAFNAMPSLHHREPGLLGEAIVNPDVYCGFIADGEHVSMTMMQLLLRASSYSQGLFLVSDALAPIGLADGYYPWDNRQIEVKQGTARLADGTLAGTTLSLFKGVENLVNWGICDVGEAIALATVSPRCALSLPVMFPGQPGRFWRWRYSQSQLSYSRLYNRSQESEDRSQEGWQCIN